MIGRTNATNPASEYAGIDLLTSVLCNNEADLTVDKEIRLCLPNVSGLGNSFYNSRLKLIEITGLTRVKSFYNAFKNNYRLETIILDGNLSNCTNYDVAFDLLPALENVSLPTGCVKASLAFSDSPLITRASLTSILASLYDFRGNGDAVTTKTLTLHTTTKLMLSSAETAEANAKGWTIA